MYLLHHQVYDPVDVIWDAEDWADLTDNDSSFLSSSTQATNMDPFDNCTPEEQAAFDHEEDLNAAYSDGLALGFDGFAEENPYDPGADLHQYFHNGWREGVNRLRGI